jgi:hypothetical protein
MFSLCSHRSRRVNIDWYICVQNRSQRRHTKEVPGPGSVDRTATANRGAAVQDTEAVRPVIRTRNYLKRFQDHS